MLRGRSKALGVEGHLRQVSFDRVWKAPYGCHVDAMWMSCGVPYGVHCGDLGTLGGTLRTPGSSRETQERLKRDSRETQDSLMTVSRQSQDSLKTVSTTPKTWIPKSEKSEMRSEPTHSSSKSSSSTNTE